MAPLRQEPNIQTADLAQTWEHVGELAGAGRTEDANRALQTAGCLRAEVGTYIPTQPSLRGVIEDPLRTCPFATVSQTRRSPARSSMGRTIRTWTFARRQDGAEASEDAAPLGSPELTKFDRHSTSGRLALRRRGSGWLVPPRSHGSAFAAPGSSAASCRRRAESFQMNHPNSTTTAAPAIVTNESPTIGWQYRRTQNRPSTECRGGSVIGLDLVENLDL